MAQGMDLRSHISQDTTSEAAYSACGRYRYWLKRRWQEDGAMVNFIMLNPSVASELKNDPTVERCERRARQMDYGAFCVTNIFAWRETHPQKLRQAKAPIGIENDEVLLEQARAADMVIAAWGTHGAHLERGAEFADRLRRQTVDVHHLGLTKDGHPRHPLYVPYSVAPRLWNLQRN